MFIVHNSRWIRLALFSAWFVLGVCLPSSSAHASALEPRAYANVPIGMNFILSGYVYGRGGLSVDPAIPLEDAEIDSHTLVVAGARSVDFWGKSGLVTLLVPYSNVSGSAVFNGEPRSRTTTGFNDPVMRVSVNLFGAPALTLKQYGAYRQENILGVSLLVSAPLGEYDSSKLLNIGANRWSFKPEMGFSKMLGKWVVEGAAAVTLFTDNTEYNSGQTREQAPIYSLQGHLTYTFRPGLWVSGSATFYTGGRTTVDGDRLSDLQQNWRTGATLAVPLTRKHSLKAYASTGVHTRTGTDFDLYGIVWQYRWGGGL